MIQIWHLLILFVAIFLTDNTRVVRSPGGLRGLRGVHFGPSQAGKKIRRLINSGWLKPKLKKSFAGKTCFILHAVLVCSAFQLRHQEGSPWRWWRGDQIKIRHAHLTFPQTNHTQCFSNAATICGSFGNLGGRTRNCQKASLSRLCIG